MKRETHGLAVVTGRLEPAAIDGLVAWDDRSRREKTQQGPQTDDDETSIWNGSVVNPFAKKKKIEAAFLPTYRVAINVKFDRTA